MPRRKNSFSRALQDAEKRLAKAIEEKKAAQSKLYALDMEIPTLVRTIAALKGHIEPRYAHLTDVGALTPEQVKEMTAPPANLTPEELAKWYVDRDLSTAGSIPPPRPVAPSTPVTEDDLLPDDFATGKR